MTKVKFKNNFGLDRIYSNDIVNSIHIEAIRKFWDLYCKAHFEFCSESIGKTVNSNLVKLKVLSVN